MQDDREDRHRRLIQIFGRKPEEAYAIAREGPGKDEIFERMAMAAAVRDVSFAVREGEIS